MQRWRPKVYDVCGFGPSLDELRAIAGAKWPALELRPIVVPVRSGMQHRGVWHWN